MSARNLMILSALLTMGLSANTLAQDSQRRVIVEDLPTLSDIHRVSAANTHSGYAVPRYVSLKFGKVNGRQGPSTQHPILWQYRRKGLPLVVVAEMDIWRKVRDHKGEESWLRTQALTGTRMVMSLGDITLYQKPDSGSNLVASAEGDVIFRLLECNSNGWCKIRAQSGIKGWAQQNRLWGAGEL